MEQPAGCSSTQRQHLQQQQQQQQVLRHSSSSSSVLGLLQRLERGGRPAAERMSRRRLSAALAGAHCGLLAPTPLSAAQASIDKAFCSVWLDAHNVLIGSKDNALLHIHTPTLQHSSVALPPQHALQPPQSAPHCGQHALAVSPCGRFLLSGGAAAQDILLWRLRRNPAACGAASADAMQLQPLRTYSGHTDWLFGLAWLSDGRTWVSAGRDRTLKLWSLPGCVDDSGYCSSELGEPLASVCYHQDKVRDVKLAKLAGQQQVVALSSDGVVSWWSEDMRLRGALELPDTSDAVALAVQGPLCAVGTTSGTLLLDTRTGRRVAGLADGGRAAKRPAQQHAAPLRLPPQHEQQEQLMADQRRVQQQQQIQQQQRQLDGGRQQQQQQDVQEQLDDGEAVGNDGSSSSSSSSDGEQGSSDGDEGGAGSDDGLDAIGGGGDALDRLLDALGAEFPPQVRYVFARASEVRRRRLASAAGAAGAGAGGRKRARSPGPDVALDGHAVEPTVTGCIEEPVFGVRSLALQHHLLSAGLGAGGTVAFYDTRRLSSCPSAPPGPGGALPASLAVLQMPPGVAQPDAVLLEHGILPPDAGAAAVETAVYSHAWSPCGTQLLTAGGPLQTTYRGCTLALWS